MKAVTWQGKRDVRVDTVPDPVIQEPTDAIIKVTSSGLCGSDLHLYEVLGPFMQPGDILGHEPMGIVEEVGSEVTHIRQGDRVVVPFNISCGRCGMCALELYSQCETTQVREHDKGAALFGYSKLYGEVPGGQAEYLRIPQAHFGPIPVPEGPPDDRFLFLSDVLPTAWQAVEYAAVPKGGSLMVIGLGPIGDMCARIAMAQGVASVIGLDLVPERLERARARSVDVIDVERADDLPAAIKELTGGRGPDSGEFDAVGMEAHGDLVGKVAHQAIGLLPRMIAAPMSERAGVDRLAALRLANSNRSAAAERSPSSGSTGNVDPIPMMLLFDKQVTLRMDRPTCVGGWTTSCPSWTTTDRLGVDGFATHHMPLESAPDAYAKFQAKEDGVVKVVFQP